jgi:two-component system response regulator QseB
MRVLLVEDDIALAQGIRTALRGEGYTLDWLADGLEAEHALRHEQFDLVLLDLGLPRKDGLSLLRGLRARPEGSVPVLVLTARDGVGDRIQGLDSGADDYLVKPFDVDELKARIRALLEHAGVSLDPARREVRYQGNPVALTPMEFQLLHQLLARPGTVLTRERIADALYGWQEPGPGNTLEVLIHNLRRKLDNTLIRTVRGVGYLIEAQG